jgi:hypothetical protein
VREVSLGDRCAAELRVIGYSLSVNGGKRSFRLIVDRYWFGGKPGEDGQSLADQRNLFVMTTKLQDGRE